MASSYSCEPGRRKAYTEEFRWRMVWQKEVMRLSLTDIAKNLNVSRSTVWRINNLFYCTGTITKRSYPVDRRATKKLTEVVKMFILNTVVDRPHLYLREIKAEVLKYTGFDISAKLICGYLKEMNFSRQKMQIIAKQRDEQLRSGFRDDVSLYEPHMLVFIDETGTDRRDSIRRYGYSLRGKPSKSCKMLIRGERISVIGIMTVNGVLDLHVVHGSADGDVFLEFLEKYLLPCLMPFNGINSNSVVILDNCSIHHVEEVAELVKEVGAMMHYLPPYSPDYNPIEWCFSKVKTVISSLECEMECTEDIELIARTAFATVTPEDCQSWIEDTGIYLL